MNGLVDFPVCGFYGKTLLRKNVDDFSRGYFRACSKDCPGMKTARLLKIGDACEKKYGCRNFFASDARKKAKEDWCAENGVENPFQLESVKEKSKKTRMERFGLYFNGVLVSVMTFGKSRFSGKYQWEMLRFCCRLGYHVPGAASRPLRHFETKFKPVSLISYADLRWSSGNLYRALWFDFIGNSPPGYFFVKGDRRYSRVAFQKHKLEKILKVFDLAKTEVQNMNDNGYFRVFDCGNAVFGRRYILEA